MPRYRSITPHRRITYCFRILACRFVSPATLYHDYYSSGLLLIPDIPIIPTIPIIPIIRIIPIIPTPTVLTWSNCCFFVLTNRSIANQLL